MCQLANVPISKLQKNFKTINLSNIPNLLNLQNFFTPLRLCGEKNLQTHELSKPANIQNFKTSLRHCVFAVKKN
jgi:hypothetical protein